jgi:hypothetical protein
MGKVGPRGARRDASKRVAASDGRANPDKTDPEPPPKLDQQTRRGAVGQIDQCDPLTFVGKVLVPMPGVSLKFPKAAKHGDHPLLLNDCWSTGFVA